MIGSLVSKVLLLGLAGVSSTAAAVDSNRLDDGVKSWGRYEGRSIGRVQTMGRDIDAVVVAAVCPKGS